MYNSQRLAAIFLLFAFLLLGCRSSIKLGVNNPSHEPYADGEGVEERGDYQNAMDKGVKVEKKDDPRLLEAAKKGNLESVKELLKNGANPDIQGEYGMTALHLAAMSSHNLCKDILLDLLQNKANPNIKDERGMTPLHYAASNRRKLYEGIVRMLLENGADPNISDNEGKAPLHKAVIEGNKEIVLVLLQNTEDHYCNTALYLAIKNDKKEIVKVLLKKADPNISDNEGKTPFHFAVKRGNKGVVEALLPKADFNTADKEGKTALHLAANNGNKQIVKLILRKCYDLNIQDNNGNTFLHIIAAKYPNLFLEIIEESTNHINFLKKQTSALMLDLYPTLSDAKTIVVDYAYPINFALKNRSGETVGNILSRQGIIL